MIMVVLSARKLMGRFKEVEFLIRRADTVRRNSGSTGSLQLQRSYCASGCGGLYRESTKGKCAAASRSE
jgi:hypothetical protein